MPVSKERNDKFFAGPVTHDDVVINNSTVTNKGAVTNEGPVVRTGRELLVPAADALAGATAGWLVTGADDGLARLPASKTDATLIIPLKGVYVGDTVTGVRVIGQVESAGANVTLIASVRKSTAVVGDFTDVELGTDNVGTLTADTLISGTVLEVTALTETLTEIESLYVLLTGTTAALTDIAISGIVVTVTEA